MLAKIFTSLALMAISQAVFADIQYFEDGIDYWGSKEKTVETSQEKTPKQNSPLKEKTANETKSKNEEFSWNTYLDPKNPEFFQEGDYTPPAPFMELARNPTDENIKLWLSYIQKKNALSERLAKRLNEYSSKQGNSLPNADREHIAQKVATLPIAANDYSRFRFRMYFDSTCPHCKKMFNTFNELQEQGYFVEARQIDRGNLEGIGANFPVTDASPEEVKRLAINSVPLILIGDVERGKAYKQSGFMTANELLTAVRSK